MRQNTSDPIYSNLYQEKDNSWFNNDQNNDNNAINNPHREIRYLNEL